MSLPNSTFLKGVGLFVIIVGLVEIGIGAEVWAFAAPENKYGSWWAAMIAVVAGIIAVIASNKVHLKVLIFFSTCACILLFSGMLVDSFAFSRVNKLQTCVDTTSGEVFGASGLAPEAGVCATQTDKLCACVGKVDVCHNYDINPYRQQNCELILTRYTDLLLISAIFTTFTLAWTFLLSVISCVTMAAVVKAENPEVQNAKETEVPMSAPADAEAPALKPETPAKMVVEEAKVDEASPAKAVETVAVKDTTESSV